MNYRTTTILANKALTGSGTETIDVNIKDPISRIFISWYVTKVLSYMTSYSHKDITKIELVDGSDVLFSMDGGQCQALCIYDRKVPTMNHGQHLSANSDFSTYGIDFGRFLHDPVLALDPSKFRNLQLKVSYDVDVSDTSVATGYLAVYGELFDEKAISPVGFLMSKEHHNRTPPSSGYWYVDLPTDRPIRKMLVQGYQLGVEAWNNVSEARLDEDNEKRIPFDWELETYYRMMKGSWKQVVEPLIGQSDPSGRQFYVTPTDFWVVFSGVHMSDYSSIGLSSAAQGGGDIVLTSAGRFDVSGMVLGYLPNHCFEFPFGDPSDPDDWYDVTRLGSLRLRLEAGSGGAAGSVAVLLQQLRRY